MTPSCSSSFIIGPDGQPLTDEERAFLEENFGKLEANDAAMDNDDVSDEYDEFLTAGSFRFVRKFIGLDILRSKNNFALLRNIFLFPKFFFSHVQYDRRHNQNSFSMCLFL